MVAEIITSPRNPRIQRLRRLSTDPSRKDDWFLLEGRTLMQEALSQGWELDSVYHTGPEKPGTGAAEYRVPEKLMRSVTAVETPPGILAVAKKRLVPIERLDPGGLALLLDGIQDPGNVGTLLRSAAAFGAGAVLATPGTAHFFNPKVVRAAAGSTFKLRLCEGVTAQNLGSLLKRSGSRLIIADSRAGVAPGALDRFNCILALGHETSGVSAALRELAAQVVRIPMAEATESLNVAVAGSIILYEISKREASNADFGMRNAE